MITKGKGKRQRQNKQKKHDGVLQKLHENNKYETPSDLKQTNIADQKHSRKFFRHCYQRFINAHNKYTLKLSCMDNGARGRHAMTNIYIHMIHMYIYIISIPHIHT